MSKIVINREEMERVLAKTGTELKIWIERYSTLLSEVVKPLLEEAGLNE